MKFEILGVFIGTPQSVRNKLMTSIVKTPVKNLVVSRHGIYGDEVGNLKHHGGDMRVIHHYSHKNYNHLKTRFPEISNRFIPGSFGENIITEELTEAELNIGDIYSLGTAKVQLTVSRRPCATINLSYDDDRILKEVMQTGRTGWFYRVLEEGEVRPGDYLEFLDRPFPDLSVSQLYNQGYGNERFNDPKFLQRCLDTGLMDKGWLPKITAALAL